MAALESVRTATGYVTSESTNRSACCMAASSAIVEEHGAGSDQAMESLPQTTAAPAFWLTASTEPSVKMCEVVARGGVDKCLFTASLSSSSVHSLLLRGSDTYDVFIVG